MSKKLISISFALVSGTALAFAGASCSSSDNNGDGGTPSGSSSSSSGGSSSGSGSSSSGSGSSSSGSSSGSAEAGPATVLIDNMEIGTNGPVQIAVPTGEFPGYWYDGVSQDSRNSLAPGTGITGGFAYSPLATPNAALPASTKGAHVTCAIHDLYGFCQEAFEFAQVYVDGGAGPDASPEASIPRVTVSFDASPYTGITFWALAGSTGSGQALKVLFPDIDTDPRGGRCGPLPGYTGDAGACYDSWGQTLTPAMLSTTTWTQVTVPFATLAGGNFGFEGTTGGVDPAHLYGVTFQVGGPNPTMVEAGVTITADFWVDDVYFTK